MAVDVQDKLERELFDVKQHASGLAQQVEALKKDLGNARKQAAKVADAEAERDAAAAALASAQKQVKALESELAKAHAEADAAAELLAAARGIADGIAAFKAL